MFVSKAALRDLGSIPGEFPAVESARATVAGSGRCRRSSSMPPPQTCSDKGQGMGILGSPSKGPGMNVSVSFVEPNDDVFGNMDGEVAAAKAEVQG